MNINLFHLILQRVFEVQEDDLSVELLRFVRLPLKGGRVWDEKIIKSIIERNLQIKSYNNRFCNSHAISHLEFVSTWIALQRFIHGALHLS